MLTAPGEGRCSSCTVWDVAAPVRPSTPHASAVHVTAKALGFAAISMLAGLLYDDTTVRVLTVVAPSCLAMAAYANYRYATGR